jgi:HAD superfamily hydrolase (TIGR01490 family)
LKTSIAFFDFDGTITKHDSLLRFLRFVLGDLRVFGGLTFLSPILLLHFFGLFPSYKAKQILLAHFFKGMAADKFWEIAKEYALNHIDTITKKSAIERIEWHKQNGHTIVIVSSSLYCWLKPWCEKYKLELIATKIEVIDGKLTGKLLGERCYGAQKVKQINDVYDLQSFDKIYAYGDTRGDKEMLEMADFPFYKFFY